MKPLDFVRIVWITLVAGMCAVASVHTTFAASSAPVRPPQFVADDTTDPPHNNGKLGTTDQSPPISANSPDYLQATNTITAGNGIYNVHIINVQGDEGIGLYTATTGPNHPAGAGRNILFRDPSVPGTTFNTVHSFTTGADYLQRPVAITPTNPITLDRFGVVTAIGTTGFRTTYALPGLPETQDKLTVVSEVNVQGTTREDSAIAVRTIVTNDGDTPVRIGIRYLWDFQIGADDGPTFQAINPDSSAVLTKETTFVAPGFESYQIGDNDQNQSPPTFVVFGTVTGPPTLTTTEPDLLQYACWPIAEQTAFAYTATVTRTVAANSSQCSSVRGGDSAVLYYFGADEAHAITIQPGASYTVAAALFATEPPDYSLDLAPPTAINDVGTQHTVTATVTDERERPIQGQQVLFTVSGANTATCLTAPPTNSNGQTTCTYRGNNVGVDRITGWIEQNGNDLRDPVEPSDLVTKTWTPVYTVTVAPPTTTRDVGTSHTVTAFVVDHNGAPVASSLPVHFQAMGVNNLTRVIPVDGGRAVFTYLGQNNESGNDTITAWIEANGNNLPDPSEFHAVATVTWRRIDVGMTGRGEGDAVSVVRTITATVQNDQGGAAQGVTVAFEVTGGTQYGPETKPADARGQAVFTYTSTAPATQPGAAQTRQVVPAQVDTITVWVELSSASAVSPDPDEPQVSIGVVTAVTLVAFASQPNDDGTITLLWETAAELDNAGFNLYRATTVEGPYVKINDQLIPAQGTGFGAHYRYVDAPSAGDHFYYKLEALDYNGIGAFHGPIEVWLDQNGADRQQQIYLPIVQQ